MSVVKELGKNRPNGVKTRLQQAINRYCTGLAIETGMPMMSTLKLAPDMQGVLCGEVWWGWMHSLACFPIHVSCRCSCSLRSTHLHKGDHAAGLPRAGFKPGAWVFSMAPARSLNKVTSPVLCRPEAAAATVLKDRHLHALEDLMPSCGAVFAHALLVF